MDVYCQRVGCSFNDVRFTFDGNRVLPESTPEMASYYTLTCRMLNCITVGNGRRRFYWRSGSSARRKHSIVIETHHASIIIKEGICHLFCSSTLYSPAATANPTIMDAPTKDVHWGTWCNMVMLNTNANTTSKLRIITPGPVNVNSCNVCIGETCLLVPTGDHDWEASVRWMPPLRLSK